MSNAARGANSREFIRCLRPRRHLSSAAVHSVQASQPSGSFSVSLEVRFVFRIGGKDVKRGYFFDFLSQVL